MTISSPIWKPSFRKLTALAVEQHHCFDMALINAQNCRIDPTNGINEVWKSADGRERVIVSTDSFGCLFVEVFRYDSRRFLCEHGRLNIGCTRFHAGSGKMIIISKYARRGTEAWRKLYVGGLGL